VQSCGGIYALRFLTKRAQLVLQSGTDLGYQVGGLFLFGGGLIRCNSVRDTVQTQHKHIPRQCNGHHSCDSEPQSSPSFVVSFKLLGFHDLRCVPIRMSLHEWTEPIQSYRARGSKGAPLVSSRIQARSRLRDNQARKHPKRLGNTSMGR
jgi:hypothetical protein